MKVLSLPKLSLSSRIYFVGNKMEHMLQVLISLQMFACITFSFPKVVGNFNVTKSENQEFVIHSLTLIFFNILAGAVHSARAS